MAHVLICGITQSGKTTLARNLVAAYRARDIGAIVLDPHRDPHWGADYQTDNPADFLAVAHNSWECALFVDEAGQYVGQFDTDMHWCGTQARHWAHRAHFITPRPVQIARTVRDQCTRLCLFAVAREDAAMLAREWNKPELAGAPELPQGQFYDVQRFGPALLRRVF